MIFREVRAARQQQVIGSKCARTEYVTLQGDAISVTAIHLNYRVNAVLQQKGGSGDVGHVWARMAMVRNLNCVRRFGENTRLFNHAFGALARTQRHFRCQR